MKKSSGFTLIELAIVLVIIGLLLGGVLKGQELINSAKAKSIGNDLKNVQILLYGYQDRYRAIPGDDAAADHHVTGGVVAAAAATRGNGRIDDAWDAPDITAESYLFWQHVRLAGLANGTPDLASTAFIPRTSDGGRLGIQSLSTFTKINGASAGANAMVGAFVVCAGGVTGRIAKQIDVQLDDGRTSTGNVRVASDGSAAGPALDNQVADAVPDGSTFTICMSF